MQYLAPAPLRAPADKIEPYVQKLLARPEYGAAEAPAVDTLNQGP